MKNGKRGRERRRKRRRTTTTTNNHRTSIDIPFISRILK
jgi:hypothetical protein